MNRKKLSYLINTCNDILGDLIWVLLLFTLLLFYLVYQSGQQSTEVINDTPPQESGSRRDWIEATFTPEDLALWDEFHQLTQQGKADQEAIDIIVADTGISEQTLKVHLQNLQHWIATKDYPYTPENLKRLILEPAISFHPGSAGSSLQRAAAAGEILFNSADKNYHFCNGLHQVMKDAISLMTLEEQGRLKENLPGLIDDIDIIIKEYPEIADINSDAGAYSHIYRAMQTEMVNEDWNTVKLALMYILDNTVM